MEQKAYSEKLKDPRWQKKSLEIFERDGWACRSCGDKDKTLHVHQILSTPKKEPWETHSGYLITLCTDCRKVERVCDGHETCEDCPEYKINCDGPGDPLSEIMGGIGWLLNSVWSGFALDDLRGVVGYLQKRGRGL